MAPRSTSICLGSAQADAKRRAVWNNGLMRWLPAALFSVISCVPAWAEDVYHVTFDEPLEQVSVSACFDGAAPSRLYHHEEARRYTVRFSADDRRLRLAGGKTSSRLQGLQPGTCLGWAVDLAKAVQQDAFRLAMRSGDALVTDAALWFWRGPGERAVRVEVSLPEGMALSTPWADQGRDGDRLVFRPDPAPASWSSRIAVGHFAQQRLQLPGAEARLAITGDLAAEEHGKLERWIASAAGAVSAVYGRFPVAAPQILIIPIGHRSEPVPWAHVMRGGGIAVEFFVDQARPLAEFQSDWTAPHELSHLLLPFVSSRDRWLSEGLASWYQYLLLARSGALTPADAWQELHEGFLRGARDSDRGESLAEATRAGWSHTMRVYWSGAALMMLADVRLRAASNGAQSLDTALAGLGDCCLANERRWRAREVFAELDRITGTSVFAELYQAHVHQGGFPELDPTWRRLGVDASGRRLRLLDSGDWRWIREAIMQAPAG